jgi:hypothetical protein
MTDQQKIAAGILWVAPPDPPPSKLTASERKTAAKAKADREAKRAAIRTAKDAREKEIAAAVTAAKDSMCGPAPKISGWDDLPVGLKSYFKDMANDPDSVEFLACTEPALRNPPLCWATACRVRAKNGFGAKVLRNMVFGKNHLGWSTIAN